jgi:alkylation response protein AidB-like acyl-CoA dehydrogenase
MAAVQTTGMYPLIEAALALEPRIRACADQIEQEGRLPDDLVRALSEAGIFRMLVPKTLGGSEVDPVTYSDVLEILSRADGSTGWCVMIGTGSSWGTAFLRPETAAEILSDPYVVMAGSFALPSGGRAHAVDGGYRVTGRWPFGSGCQHAAWMVGHSVIYDGESPRLGPSGAPLTRVMVFPRADATIIPTWDAIGMNGTGSHDYTVSDLFVPDRFTFALDGESAYHDGPLYKGRFFLVAHSSHALGIARAAIDAYMGLVATKRQSGGAIEGFVRDRPHIQVAIAQAEALVRSARTYLRETTREVFDEAATTGTITPVNRALARLAITSSFESCRRAIDVVYTAGGGSSVYRRSPLQRYFRDIHTASQHAVVGPGSSEIIGQALLSGGSVDQNTGRRLF